MSLFSTNTSVVVTHIDELSRAVTVFSVYFCYDLPNIKTFSLAM